MPGRRGSGTRLSSRAWPRPHGPAPSATALVDPVYAQSSTALVEPVYGTAADAPDRGRFRGWFVLALRPEDFLRESVAATDRSAVTVSLSDITPGEDEGADLDHMADSQAMTAMTAGVRGRDKA